MNIVKAEKQDIVRIMEILSGCIASMDAQGIYQWNQYYPDVEIIGNAVREACSCIRLDAYSQNKTALRLFERWGYTRMGQGFLPFKEFPFFL